MLIETIDKTIQHLKGRKKMKSDEMFVGFSVAAGSDRFGEEIKLGGEPLDCKVSAQDTKGAMSVFEFTSGWPRHLHHDQDEWIYVIDGEWEFEVGDRRFRVGAGESVFLPRKVSHVWCPVGTQPGKIINVYQPAGKMEEFFRELGNFKNPPSREQVINKTYTEEQKNALAELFEAYGMDLLGPGLIVE
jgi:mannose-6-phosphate isomerase-like protein (cupin superfamily)